MPASELRLLRNSCRRLKADSMVPLLPSRHSRTGLSYAAAARLRHRSPPPERIRIKFHNRLSKLAGYFHSSLRDLGLLGRNPTGSFNPTSVPPLPR